MPSIRLKVSVSGIRGVVGETLTPRLICHFAQAFGTYVGPGKVLVGRDTRPSGAMVSQAVFAGLMATGCEPVDLGVAPIPAIQLRCARRPDVCGAVAVTASHNPAEWNALKLMSADGLFLGRSQASDLLDIYNQGNFRRVAGTDVPGVGYDDEAVASHLDAVLAEVDVDTIRAAGLRVAIDCVNGAGAVAAPRLLSRLGCHVVRIACQPSGHFSRPPEPRPENLTRLCEQVLQAAVAVGLAQDADADRLGLVDQRGRALDGDQVLALLVDLVLRRRAGPVVVNLSTSRLIDHVAAAHGVPVHRSPVGEANVVAEIERTGAVVGGEGSGGLIYPAIHPCRDSFIAMALLLEHLARREQTLAQMLDALPARVMLRDRLPLPAIQSRRLVAALRSRLVGDADALDLRDGIRADWPAGWLHLRRSNTEPIVRVIVEADTSEQAASIKRRVTDTLRDL